MRARDMRRAARSRFLISHPNKKPALLLDKFVILGESGVADFVMMKSAAATRGATRVRAMSRFIF